MRVGFGLFPHIGEGYDQCFGKYQRFCAGEAGTVFRTNIMIWVLVNIMIWVLDTIS